jgi:hypothetical protein
MFEKTHNLPPLWVKITGIDYEECYNFNAKCFEDVFSNALKELAPKSTSILGLGGEHGRGLCNKINYTLTLLILTEMGFRERLSCNYLF